MPRLLIPLCLALLLLLSVLPGAVAPRDCATAEAAGVECRAQGDELRLAGPNDAVPTPPRMRAAALDRLDAAFAAVAGDPVAAAVVCVPLGPGGEAEDTAPAAGTPLFLRHCAFLC